MTTESSWIVGSVTLSTTAAITVGGTPVAVAAGTYYLYDATGSLSLLDAVLAAVAPEMTDEAIVIGRDRKVRITASVNTTWTAIDSRLQTLLGIESSFGPTQSYTGTAVSTLLWSPGWCATTDGSPGGVTGYEEPTRAHTSSLSGQTQNTTVHGTSRKRIELSWFFVLRSRAWTAASDDGDPGDYRRFWVDVLKPGAHWKWYPEVTEADTGVVDATAVTWPTALGPYKTEALGSNWNRSIDEADTHTGISLDGLVSGEIS